MYVYDEFLQQHRKLVSKLDLEEKRRREAQEKGQCTDPLWKGLQYIQHSGMPPLQVLFLEKGRLHRVFK